MDIKEIASQILKTTSKYTHSLLLAGLNKDRGDEKAEQESREKMKEAEEALAQILTGFQNSILKQVKDSGQ